MLVIETTPVLIKYRGPQVGPAAIIRRSWPVLRFHEFLETRPSLLADLRDHASDSTWREFFELYAPPVYNVARMSRLGAADAEDIVQQVMVTVIGHIGTFDYQRDRGRFRQWVLRIADNKIRDLVRKRRTERRETFDVEQQADEAPPVNSAWEQQWRLQDVLFCLEQVASDISPRRMQVFRLYMLQGVSAEQTALEAGVTPGYVYVTRTEVLGMIRERLKRLASDLDGQQTPCPGK